jgi:tRNA U34 5-carboxymethylaminomethyl modifying GTPase MnmE/TrmE
MFRAPLCAALAARGCKPGALAWLHRFGVSAREWLTETSDEKDLVTFVILGRPNVGKSTLFNRLTGRRTALVHDTPSSHVTRDYKEGIGSISDLKFKIIDTSGLEPVMQNDSVQGRATQITQQVRIGSL